MSQDETMGIFWVIFFAKHMRWKIDLLLPAVLEKTFSTF